MVDPITSSRREQSRYALTGLLAGHWQAADGGELDVLPVDVSSFGFGLLMNPGPKVGDLVHWQIPGMAEALVFQVAWCLASQASHDFSEIINMRRCGLRLETAAVDLLAICQNMPGLELLD